ncbi:cytochrome c [Variovorax dokdonensis]|uniref:Cytochrome c n=1 Tax=Variovorax dokdonensis TaxID=344883 RepID=A0ABT7NFZ6_9BURK|nr:cytochrome c [Variovorax dokdonensis]MDM0046877.1 cytochrome c [Variovorax dokdonensis]
MHPIGAHLVLVAAALTALPAAAQFAKKDDAVQYRESAMFLMNTHFGRVAAMANGRVPFDAVAAASNAQLVAQLAKLPWPAFAEGFDGGKAKDEIWKEQAKFKDLGAKMEAETAKLAEVAAGGQLEAIKAQVGRVGASCKACHDDFRKR